MLAQSELPRNLWAETVSMAAYLQNRSPSTAVEEKKTPFELWFGSKPNVAHLCVFGCTAYAHVEKDEHSKFDSKAEKCCFLGYLENSKGYRLYSIKRKQVLRSRNVTFNETVFGG